MKSNSNSDQVNNDTLTQHHQNEQSKCHTVRTHFHHRSAEWFWNQDH